MSSRIISQGLSCTEEGMCVGVGGFIFWQILPSFSLYVRDTSSILGLIKHVHDVINLLYYKHWTDKWKYIPYISVTHKVLKSCRSKMATLAHDVCDVHGASSLYIKTCWQSLYRVFPTGGMGESPHQPKICSFTPSPPNFYSLPPKVNSTQ